MTPNFEAKIKTWIKSASIRLTHPEKRELKTLCKDWFKITVNISCSNCVVDALNRVAKRYQHEQKAIEKPIEQPIELETLSLAELKEIAKAKGAPLKRSKADQIAAIRSKS